MVNSVTFSPGGRTALIGGVDKTLKLLEIPSGRLIRSFEGHTQMVWSVAFSPDGCTALSGSHDNTLKLWDVASGRLIHSFEGHKGVVNSVAFSPDGRTALSASDDGTLKLWNLGSAACRVTYTTSSEGSLALRYDGAFTCSGDPRQLIALVRGAEFLPMDDFIARNRRDRLD